MQSIAPVSGQKNALQRILVAFIASVMLFGLSVHTAEPAEALSASKAGKVIKVATSLKGTPYRWGGTSKKGFDCSGYTQYVFKHALNKSIPRTAGGQLKYKKVSKANRAKGDLIIFISHGSAYHVGIYAGGGQIWHSPRTGQRVKKVKIWTSGYVVRRVA